MEITNLKKVYFLGIGGIGMSALARYLHGRGVAVSGYDKTESALTQSLVAEGIPVHYIPDQGQVPVDADLVVFTPAVPMSLSEWDTIREHGLRVMKRSALLAEIVNQLSLIAVAGTHGKTTTSAMIAHILSTLKIPFLGFVGGMMNRYNTNTFVHPQATYAVAEADEYDRSFLALFPKVAVINAIDADHLDIYGNAGALEEAFIQFANQTHGIVLLSDGIDRKDITWPSATLTFGFDAHSHYVASDIMVERECYRFSVYYKGSFLAGPVMLPAAGRHNVRNALAAIASVHCSGMDANHAALALNAFPGVKRRLETIAKNSRLICIDDYAHHPIEIESLIHAVRELYPGKKISGVFQPHLFSRTRDFGQGFAAALSLLDQAWITDIYPAREEPIQGINAQWLLQLMDQGKGSYVAFNDIPGLAERCDDGILLTIGAGDIDTLLPQLIKRINAG